MFLKEFFEKVNFEKIQRVTKKHEKLVSVQRSKSLNVALRVLLIFIRQPTIMALT